MPNQYSIPDQPWRHSLPEIYDSLSVAPEEGLDQTEVKRRRQQFGSNRLQQTEPRSIWDILVAQFESMVVLLLVVAGAVSFAVGELVDASAIGAVVLINAAIGFFTELRAVRSMEALQEMGQVMTKVRRNGQTQEVSAEELVPGDLVVLESGDVVTADLRLLEASKLQANESALTGESVPVSKQVDPLDEAELPLAERANMLFKGTAVTRGAGKGVVVATGMETELGNVSSLVEEAEDEHTPLEQRLDEVGHKLIWLVLGTAALVAVVGLLQNREWVVMLETSIALAVAAIPEGLPIVATITLARGMQRMARRNALINRLASVETLGGTTVICTDKTGTLTENQMTVTRLVTATGPVKISGEGLETEGDFSRNGQPVEPAENDLVAEILKVGVFCNNAALADDPEGGNEAVGDPVEIALLVAGAKAGMRRGELLEEAPEEREVTFDPEVKMMATFHQDQDGSLLVAVKGSPEQILNASDNRRTSDGDQSLNQAKRDDWLAESDTLAEEGLRVLAIASKKVDSVETDPYQNLTFLGLIAMLDPPREEVRPAIDACQAAGIRVIMVTGDQPLTARQVGYAVGLVKEDQAQVIHGSDLKPLDTLSKSERERILAANILARVTPEQKLRLIDIHQQAGAVVAMTGDGVNDAPALKKADIGVAMGQRGTQVAKEAADMVLQDDSFPTIVAAVEHGRVIFNNIRKFIVYHLSGNISEIIAVALASLVNAPLPLLPLQILFLNVGIDVFPALALGLGGGGPGIMDRPPREPDEPIMTRQHWTLLGGYGLLLALTILVAMILALNWLGMATQQAVTVSFLTLAWAKLWHVFNMRDRGSHFFKNEITTNPFVWGALAICVGLILAAVYLPWLANVLKVVNPGPAGWSLALGMSLIPLLVGQLAKYFPLVGRDDRINI